MKANLLILILSGVIVFGAMNAHAGAISAGPDSARNVVEVRIDEEGLVVYIENSCSEKGCNIKGFSINNSVIAKIGISKKELSDILLNKRSNVHFGLDPSSLSEDRVKEVKHVYSIIQYAD